MISDSTYFIMMNNAIAGTASSIPATLVMNGGTITLPTSIPSNAVLINGSSLATVPSGMTISNATTSTATANSIAEADRPFVCDVCGNKYKSKPGLNYHRLHSHQDPAQNKILLGNQAMSLSFGGVASTTPSISAANSVEATEATIAAVVAASTSNLLNNSLNAFCEFRPYVCKVCGAKYKSKPGLNYHRLHVHLEPSKSQSMVTDMSYSELLRGQPASCLNESALAAVVSSSADACRHYVCEVCGAKYKSKPGLTYHRIRTHQHEKPPPFVCQVCGATYKSKPGLAYHRLHVHHNVGTSNDKKQEL